MPTVELTHVRNLTTQTDIFKGDAKKCLDVVDLSPSSLVFHAPAQGRVGHQVELSGTVLMNKKTFKFEATGKIAAIEPDETESNRIEIHLHQFDKVLWKNLILQIKEDRGRLEKVFSSMRGDDEA